MSPVPGQRSPIAAERVGYNLGNLWRRLVVPERIAMIDEGNQEALAIEVGTPIPATRVIRELEELIAWQGRPVAIRVDNGPELLAQVFVDC